MIIDIGATGVKEEYELSKPFFDDLLKSLDLGEDCLFMVPGNHDVNRTKYRPSEILSFPDMRHLNEELENPDYRSDLLKGMNDYFDFAESAFSVLKPIGGRLVPFVQIHTSRCEKRIGLVGLNSAWM